MEPGAVNSFLDQFLALADSGFGLIRGDVTYVLNALIVISVSLAGVQWILAQEAPIAPFFRKVLFVGLFAFLINNWQMVAGAINQSGALLGIRAGGSSLTLADLHNPGRVAQIGVELFGRISALGEGMSLIAGDAMTLLTIFVTALLVMLGFFVLALQLFVTLITFKLGSLAAFVALPWGVFSGTAWVAERPLGWVVACAMRLFVLAFIASISISFVEALPATLALEDGGLLNTLLFGLTVLALAWFGPQLANEVVQGQPHLAAADSVRGAIGATAMGASVVYLGYSAGKFVTNGAKLAVGAASRTMRSGGATPINYSNMQPRSGRTPPNQPKRGAQP